MSQTFQTTEQTETLKTVKTPQEAETSVTFEPRQLTLPVKASKVLGQEVSQAEAAEQAAAVVETATAEMTAAKLSTERQILVSIL